MSFFSLILIFNIAPCVGEMKGKVETKWPEKTEQTVNILVKTHLVLSSPVEEISTGSCGFTRQQFGKTDPRR